VPCSPRRIPSDAAKTISQYVVPRLIGAFVSENPRVQLTFHSSNIEEISGKLVELSQIPG